ncbi:MAG: amidohydrolase family protein [Gammaproteobacteria bacterium]|nr:amidohydrolase family protein [Gammaproteobacteria bacterium]
MNGYIDSHQHFWQLSRGDYDWLDNSPERIRKDFLPDHLRPILTDAEVIGTVLVQAAPTEAETSFLLELAERTEFVAGVVGWMPLDAEDAADKIDRLAENPWFKGVRPMIQDIADDEWMLKPELDAPLKRLIRHGLCFDALVKPWHLPNLLRLLKRYPKLRSVVNHGAKPDIASGAFDDWSRDIAAIANETGAFCKLSGLLTEAGFAAGISELKPYVEHLLECFGPERLMWGSDWPVLLLAGDYRGWLSMVKEFTSRLGEPDKSSIMGGNCAKFYRLESRRTDRRLLRLHLQDNILVCCQSLAKAERISVEGVRVELPTTVETGHKIASSAISKGEKVIKYGVPIGTARVDILLGDHVHLHNLKSDYVASHHRGGKRATGTRA